MKKRLLAIALTFVMTLGLMPVTAMAEEAFQMPEVGFTARMNLHSGSQHDEQCNDGETLEVDLAKYTSAYIKPRIEGVPPGLTSSEADHIYYTFQFDDCKNNEISNSISWFGNEYIYNRANTGNDPSYRIVAKELADERLKDEDTGKDNYYQLTVKAYRTFGYNPENPATDRCLGTRTVKLHVRMTWTKPVLDWLESSSWDKYYIENNLDKIYHTKETFAEESFKVYAKTCGCDKPEDNWLYGIPVTWELKNDTEYSAEPGATNTFTWTAHPDQALDYDEWEIPKTFPLSGNITFQNPFSVTFMDGDQKIGDELLLKNGSALTENQFPPLPTKEGYDSSWNMKPDEKISANTVINVVYTPIAYSITYELDGGTNVDKNPSSYTTEDTITLAAPSKDGYLFAGWTYAGQDTPEKETTIPVGTTGALTFTAHWVKAHTITVTSSDNGTITPSGDVAVAEGNDQTFTITPDEGYHIKDVLVDGVSAGAVATYTFTNVTTAHTIKAIFAKDSTGGSGHTTRYTLQYESNGGTEYKDERYVSGSTVKLDKTPTREGYDFTGWYSDKGTTDRITSIKMNSDKTVYAGWKFSGVLNAEDHVAYVHGYLDGTVGPNRNITRAETAVMLYRLLTEKRSAEITTTSNSFSDVPASVWYSEAVSSMANGGYITGYSDGTFGGEKSITRAEFVTMMVRFISPAEGVNQFTDVPTTHWAYQFISTATAAGWISGYTDGSFGPEKPITRAEAMTIINRVLNRGVDKDSELLDFKVWPDNNPSDWFYYDVIEATNGHEYTGSRPSENWTKLIAQ